MRLMPTQIPGLVPFPRLPIPVQRLPLADGHRYLEMPGRFCATTDMGLEQPRPCASGVLDSSGAVHTLEFGGAG